jgi:valyl-tRNA synthetase
LDLEAVERMRGVMSVVRALRAVRSQLNVPPALQIVALYVTGNPAAAGLLVEHGSYVRHLAKLKELKPASGRPAHSATAAAGSLTFYVPLEGLIDFEKEKKRLAKELERLSHDLSQCEGRLSDKAFMDRAPESEVSKLQKRRQESAAEHAALLDTLKSLEAS